MSNKDQLDFKALLALLDLEEPDQFEYFEHLADLLETEQPVSPEACYSLFAAVPENTVRELLGNYFDDIMKNIPDATVELYTLLSSIRASLIGLTHGLSRPDNLRKFADELIKFHDWYASDAQVTCKRLSDGEFLQCSVCEALALYRLEKLNEEEYDYDFDPCLDYELEEYSMSLNDMMAAEWEDDTAFGHHHHEHRPGADGCGCEEEHFGGDHCGCGDDDPTDAAPPFDAYTDGLIDRENPVIDGAYEDEPE